MPGNDSGDRLHNFFLQDNSSPVQHHQQIADGSWSVVNNNLWVGSPSQFGVSSANTKNYNLQHSDIDRGQSSHPFHGPHGLNFSQTRSDDERHPSQNQQLNLNGFTFGSRVDQTRQNETNISVVDTVPDQYNFVSRGLSMYESHQGIVPQHHMKSPVRSGIADSPVGFDLFGNQQQMHHPQFSMLHLQRHQPGFSDMHPLQQQIIFRKMQELQRQQQLRQLDNMQRNAVNLGSSVAKQSSGGYPSALANSSPNSDSGNNLSGAGIGNMNWQHNASPVMQGSSNGPVFSSNDGQAHRLMDVVPQHGDRSLYGVPVSGSRGNVSQFPPMASEKPLVQQMATFANSLPGNQFTAFSEQAGMQNGSLVSRQRFPGESSFERPSLNIQQEDYVQRVASPQDIHQEVSNSQSKLATSQNDVSLDPTEERILFGSDDNIFATFSKNPDMSEDGGGPFDSFQSGTWSALMQSAVAETSTSDIGQQDDLCGMSSQNTSVHPTNQHPAYSGRQEMSFNSDMPFSLNTSAHSGDNNGKNTDYQNVLGVHQLENKLGREHDQRLQSSSSQREPNNMSNPRALQNAVTQVRPMHGHASSQHSQSGLGLEYGISNGWNTLGSVAPADRPETSSQHSQGYEQNRVEGVHGGVIWNSSSMPHSSVEAEHAKSVVGNLPTTRDAYSVASPNMSNARFNGETSQGNYWKNVNPMVKSYGGESMEGSRHHMNIEKQTVDASLNSSNKADFPKQKGNSKDSYASNFSGNYSSGSMKETGISDVSDSPSQPSRNQKMVNQIGGWNSSGPPKFQFHPMGNLDEVEPQHGMKQSSSSLGVSHKSTNYGQVNTSQIPESSMEMKKGHLADPNNAKDISNTPGNFLDHTHNAKDIYSSQNMLELLDKVDQSKDHEPMMHSSPSGYNDSSEKHETNNSGSVVTQLQRSQSSNSQGFALQLGPPSHRAAVSNQHFLSQNNLQSIANSHLSQAAPELIEKGQLQLPASPSGQCFPSVDERVPGEFKRNRSGLAEQAINNAFMHKLQGNLSSSQFQYLQHMARTSGQVSTEQYDAYSIQKGDLRGRPSIGQSAQTMFLNARNFQHDNTDALAVSSQQIGAANQHSMGWVPPPANELVSVSQSVCLPGITQPGNSSTLQPNMWSNVTGQPHLFSTHIHKTTPNDPLLHQASVLESSSSVPRREGEQDALTDYNSPSVSGANSMKRDSPGQKDSSKNINSEKDRLQGMEPVSYNSTAESPARTAMTLKDIEAFGRSLVSDKLAHQHYSLLNQMQAMKSAEPDTNDRALKRMKGPEGSVVEHQKLTSNAASRNEGLWSLTSSGDSGVPSFSGLADNAQRKISARFANVPSENIIAPGQEDSQANVDGKNPATPRGDHPHVSPQIAPSWFNHGTFRNGQMLAINDTWRGTISKTAEKPFTICKPSSGLHTSILMEQVSGASVDPGQHLNIPQSSTILTVPIEPQSLELNMRSPKKRKRQMFCYIPWHKEVSQKSQTIRTIRMSEEVWARTVNRIPEKIGDEVDLSGNGPTTLKAKRRLSLTTHLMQHFSDKRSEKVDDRHLSKVVQDFRGRARNLETHFCRLDKGVSLADLRVECQELEKFSVINRFAKFHGRGQSETLNPSSSSDGSANKAPRPYLHRYVTALPAPRSLPDRVHCLPL
ncbi:hypothetical protein Leryth_021240 [Lithospermum erythrorhizon]|nr:hypothetical protein Leryth_021240 [Lithospermum erythrorhizon]